MLPPGWAADELCPPRGGGAPGKAARERASERVLRGAGARQVEPWGAAAGMVYLGLGGEASP